MLRNVPVTMPLLVLLLGAPLLAQSSGATKAPATAAPHEKGEHDAKAREVDSNRSAGIHRATRLIAASVVTPDGKDVGKVEDVVFDPADGRIQYAVLAADAFLGTKDRLVAVPGDVLKADSDPSRVTLAGVDKARLAAAPAFAKTEWPKDGDRDWVGQVCKYYGSKPSWESAAGARSTDKSADKSAAGGGAFRTVRASSMLHTALTTPQGAELGTIDNLALDLPHGQVRWVVVHPAESAKGKAVGADHRVAVPWSALAKGSTPSKLVLAIDPARFATAPGFASDKWPDMFDAKWAADNDAFYAAHPTAASPTDSKAGKEKSGS